MCQHCEDRYPLDSEYMLFEIVNWKGKQPAILVQYSAPDSYSDVTDLVVPINFCPMCGRSLTKHAPDVVESAASTNIIHPSEVSASEADSTPATTQVM